MQKCVYRIDDDDDDADDADGNNDDDDDDVDAESQIAKPNQTRPNPITPLGQNAMQEIPPEQEQITCLTTDGTAIHKRQASTLEQTHTETSPRIIS